MNNDLISRSALKKEVENLVAGGAERLKDYYENGSKKEENEWIGGVYDVWELIDNAPTVEIGENGIDLEKYSDRLYKIAYEKGKAEAERPQGEEWLDNFIKKYNANKDFQITDIRDREKLLDDLRPQGKWIKTQEDRWIYPICSECGYKENVVTNYCANCGAKMDKEE